MRIFLTVILALAALISLIMCSRLRFHVIWDGGLTVSLEFLCFKYQLYPAKPKKIRLRDYSPRAIERRKRKEAKKASKKAAKKKKKPSAKQAKPQKREIKDVMALVRQFTRLAKLFIGKFGAILRIDISALRFKVATGDASKTGVTYGVVVQGVAYATAFIEDNVEVRYHGGEPVLVAADFCGETFDADIDVTFSMRIGRLLAAGISCALALFQSNQ